MVGFVDAKQYNTSGHLIIPSINLESDVTALSLDNGNLPTPEAIVGSYSKAPHKTLLIGHSSTVFMNLSKVNIGDTMIYSGVTYEIISAHTLAKSEINMNRLLEETPRNTLVIMTCAGESLANGDATHRLILYAVES